jgi:molybdopterin-binding protein
MKLSARNQIPATVTKVTAVIKASDVILATGG